MRDYAWNTRAGLKESTFCLYYILCSVIRISQFDSGLPMSHLSNSFLLKQFLSLYLIFFVSFITFCDYVEDPYFLASFVEILFLRGPMTLKCDRRFAAWSRAQELCKFRLPTSRLWIAASPVPFQNDKLSNLHRLFLVSLNLIQSSRHKDPTKMFEPKKKKKKLKNLLFIKT